MNEIAWRLEVPWIDCGILGSQNLVRVNAYVPSQDAPCLECPWSQEEYALLEQEYLCSAGSGAAYQHICNSALVLRVKYVLSPRDKLKILACCSFLDCGCPIRRTGTCGNCCGIGIVWCRCGRE